MSDVYDLGENLGLSRTDIDSVLKDISDIQEEQDFIMGVPSYAGLNYGTVSIKDF